MPKLHWADRKSKSKTQQNFFLLFLKNQEVKMIHDSVGELLRFHNKIMEKK